MAEEGFEHYHIPQQSRRDKLRVLGQNQPGFVESSTILHPTCATLPSLYDPSLISSHLLACANQQGHGFHSSQNNVPLSANNQACKEANQSGAVKEEGCSNSMMGFAVGGTVGGVVNGSSSASSSSSSISHHAYLDPESSLHLNQSAAAAIQVINNNPFLYQAQSLQNLREFDQGYNDGSELMVLKPEPLSLSLSSHNHQPLELNLQRYGPAIYSDKVGVGVGSGGCVIPGLVGGGSASSASNEVSRNSVPLGPFTGYASVLKGSRFLKPAQQLLQELCDVGVRGIYTEKITADASLMESLSASEIGLEDPLGNGNEGRKNKSMLLTMLDEVYRRYRHYYQQMHAVVTSFEYVAGLGNAAPYASLAINAMSKHFRCLKNAITDQLQFISKAHFQISDRKDESPRFGQRPGFPDHQQPIWRPQRGLPERAVSVLRAWLFEHFLHPYPTDTDKLMLAKQTGLSRSQVSNWFINARVRLWKPMVEEIHMLESHQAQRKSQREEHGRNNFSDHLPSDNATENPSTSMDKFQDVSCKRTRNELPNMPVRSQEQLNQTNTSNQQVGVGVSMGNGVSLTLGLHQNHGIGFSEPFSMSEAQRFGLALQPEGYVTSGFESQNRHFRRDVIGGQLLHDFVG